MPISQLIYYVLKFFIPGFASLLFRLVLGYRSKRSAAWGIILYTVYSLFLPAYLIVTLGYDAYSKFSWIILAFGTLFAVIFTTDTLSKTIFLLLAQSGVVTIVSVLLNLIRTLLHLSYADMIIMELIVCPLLFLIAAHWWAKPLRFLADTIEDGILSLMALPLLTLAIVNIIPVYPHDSFHLHPIYCTILMIAAETAFFLYLYVLYKNLKRISFLSRQNIRTELLSQEIAHYQSYLDTAAENRHDQRHHDSIVLEYLENNDTASAIQYLQHHEAVLAEGALKQYCMEPTVNAVLRIYEKRCQEDHITFHADAVLPSVLNIDAADLGGMLGNLFENAVHAASKSKDGFLSFSSKIEDGSLLIELTNSSPDTAEFHNGLPVSHRPGGGTGTRSIKAAVQKYNGILSFSQSGNTFIARIIIPMHA